VRSSTLVVLALSACGQRGPTSAVCEQAFERALEHHASYVAEVMAETPASEHAALRRRAAEEVGALATRFVPACEADTDFKSECFTSREAGHSPACRTFVNEFYRDAR
jgi:hypothetical protein